MRVPLHSHTRSINGFLWPALEILRFDSNEENLLVKLKIFNFFWGFVKASSLGYKEPYVGKMLLTRVVCMVFTLSGFKPHFSILFNILRFDMQWN